jgi:hypothetical protein
VNVEATELPSWAARLLAARPQSPSYALRAPGRAHPRTHPPRAPAASTLNPNPPHPYPLQPEPDAPAAAEAIDAWSLAENAGRAYAAIDGDISPMHLYK